MITRSHVCLQCRLRLARQVPSNPSRIRAAFNSTSANRPRSGENGEEDDTKRQYIRPQSLHETNASRNPLRAQDSMGKLHGLHGKKLREERERLHIDALGEPADVIVLRDSKFRTYSHVQRIVAAEEPEPIDILAALDNERGLPGQQEVEENINQFRPKEGEGPQDWEAFNTLVKDIQAGFTTSQLARYVRSFSDVNGDDISAPRDPSLIPHISPWMPESSQAGQNSDDTYTRGYSLASYTSKQKLVLRLLRECWKVEVLELEYGVGEVELELKPKDYDLLLRGSRSVLGQIAAEYIIGDNERIDGFRSKHTIRITTTRQKSEMIIDEIEAAVRNIRRENISIGDLMQPGHNPNQLSKWADEQFSPATIRYLSRMTNTRIDVLPKKRLLISCVDQNPDLVTGNRIDTVIRLLVTSATFSNRVTNWLSCREAAKSSSGAFVLYPAIEGLGWRDRLRQWTRWTAPIAKIADHSGGKGGSNAALKTRKSKASLSSAETEKSQPEEATREMPAAVDDSQVGISESATTSGWQDSYQIESSALIGSVLHSHSDTIKVETMALQPRVKTAKMNRAFSSSVPNLSRILGSKAVRGIRDKPHRTLIMRFQPNPFFKSAEATRPLGAAALSAFPAIEMRFSIDSETNAFKVRSILAVGSVENSDVMLPESPSDIRFQQRSVSSLIPTQPDVEYPPGIAQFLRDATLDIQQGNFDAPAKLTIPIASHLYQQQGSEPLGDADEDGTRHVEYLFTGLEVRKTVMMAYDGWRLHYTSIEAGRAGGRRGELRLLPVRLDKSSKPATEEEFVDAAFKLAEGVEGLGTASIERPAKQSLVTKPWVDSRRDESRTERVPKYFSRSVGIRRPVPVVHDGDSHEGSIQEPKERPVGEDGAEYGFVQVGDNDQFA